MLTVLRATALSVDCFVLRWLGAPLVGFLLVSCEKPMVMSHAPDEGGVGGIDPVAESGEIPPGDSGDAEFLFLGALEIQEEDEEGWLEAPLPPMPFDFTLTNRDGREVDGVIFGKEGSEIAFRREVDGMEFLIDIESLASDSRDYLAPLEDGYADEMARLRLEREEFAQSGTELQQRRPLGITFLDSVEEALENAKDFDAVVLVAFLGSTQATQSEEGAPRPRSAPT